MSTPAINTNITKQLIELVEKAQQRFERVAVLDKLRADGIKKFSQSGIPGKKSESYKYSNPEKLFKADIVASSAELASKNIDVNKYNIPLIDADIVVLVNGVYVANKSKVNSNSKIIISSLADSIKTHPIIAEKYLTQKNANSADAFSSLNEALTTNGLFIYSPEGVISDTPLHIINVTDANANSLINPTHLFVFEKNTSATIIESQVNSGNSGEAIVNGKVILFANENAHVNYYVIQDDSVSNKINTTDVYQQNNSHVDTCTITLNTNWCRNNLNISLAGKNCETHLNGLFILNDKQHLDNHTMVNHLMPNCESNQLYKGILRDSSTGVFNGKIFVQRDAQKTNAYQSSKNILLSDNATINAKPELEIYADDVKCSHGSSTGKIDDEALFYLRSRGIGEESARILMLQAFAGDVIEKIKNESLREYLLEAISSKF